jgi:hypothetical protein
MKPSFLKQKSESAFDGSTMKYKAMVKFGDQTLVGDRWQESKDRALFDLEKEIEARLFGTITEMHQVGGHLVQVKCSKSYDSFQGTIKFYYRYYTLQTTEYGPEWVYLPITNKAGDLLVNSLDIKASENELRSLLSAAIESGKIQVPG